VTITNSGIIRDRRVHILNGADWARNAGTDFWLIGGANEETSATGAGLRTLDGGGWTTTGITEYSGSAGTLFDSTDDDPSSYKFDSGSDLLNSPAIFGSYSHGRMAQEMLGSMPTTLNLEARFKYDDATGTDEPASGIGFVDGGGSIITAADAVAVIYSDGTNFKLRSSAATSSAGAVDDNNWHIWKITITSAAITWYNNGTLVNTIAVIANKYPVQFGVGVEAAEQNFSQLAWAHVWYS
jgi:hypothetical protein